LICCLGMGAGGWAVGSVIAEGAMIMVFLMMMFCPVQVPNGCSMIEIGIGRSMNRALYQC
jgi:hypothetical protein